MTDANGTPAQAALDLMLHLVEDTDDTEPQLAAWRGFTALIDGAGLLDDLDEHDARHMVGALLVDLTYYGPQRVRERADHVATGEWDETLHHPTGVVTALRQIADLADRPRS